MDNLSGGEKTVAALALLFGIHRFVHCLALYSQQLLCSTARYDFFDREYKKRPFATKGRVTYPPLNVMLGTL